MVETLKVIESALKNVLAALVLVSVFRYSFNKISDYLFRKLDNYKLIRKAMKALNKQNYKGHEAVLGFTIYEPTNGLNPNTGKKFIKQKLRTVEARLKLTDIFHEASGAALIKMIDRASKFCTPEKPLVFQHFDKLGLSQKALTAVQQSVMTAWINYFSEEFFPQNLKFSPALNEGEVAEEVRKAAVLVYEPGAVKSQLRILIVDLMKGKDAWIPNFPNMPESCENLTFPTRDRNFKYEPDSQSHYNVRHTTNTAIKSAFNDEKTEWCTYGLSVAIPTGAVMKLECC